MDLVWGFLNCDWDCSNSTIGQCQCGKSDPSFNGHYCDGASIPFEHCTLHFWKKTRLRTKTPVRQLVLVSFIGFTPDVFVDSWMGHYLDKYPGIGRAQLCLDDDGGICGIGVCFGFGVVWDEQKKACLARFSSNSCFDLE